MNLLELLQNMSSSVGEKQWEFLMCFRETIKKYGYSYNNELHQYSTLIWRILLDVGSEGYQNTVIDIIDLLEILGIEKPTEWHDLIIRRYMPYTKEGTEFYLNLITRETKKFGFLSKEYNKLNHIQFILRCRIESDDYINCLGIFDCN